MNFGQALEELKAGNKVAREGWNGNNLFIFLVPSCILQVKKPPLLGVYPKNTVINYLAHVDMKTAQEDIVPWNCSQADMLAEDWGVV